MGRTASSGATAWINAKRASGILVSENSFRERERPEYVMAHSLAHTLMTEVAIHCGYPASALKERLYAFPRVPGQPMSGYLTWTLLLIIAIGVSIGCALITLRLAHTSNPQE